MKSESPRHQTRLQGDNRCRPGQGLFMHQSLKDKTSAGLEIKEPSPTCKQWLLSECLAPRYR